MLSSSNEDDHLMDMTPPEVLAAAQIARDSQSEKSKEKYTLLVYESFLKWKSNKNANSFSENVLLAYFNELATNYKPSTLWCFYSKLKSMIKSKQNIDIKNYSILAAFLKRRSVGFKGNKSKVLSAKHIEKFLDEAPDNTFLATKVALIFSITGACRLQELTNITTNDIEQHGEMLLVKIPNTRSKITRSFIINGQFYDVVKKYEALRSPKARNNRFFQNFRKGKCIAQPIGINKFGNMPREIAIYLELPDAASYVGHSFTSSATLLANSGAEIIGGWRSNTVAESYIKDWIGNKTKVDAKIPKSVTIKPNSESEPRPSTSRGNVWRPPSGNDILNPEMDSFLDDN